VIGARVIGPDRRWLRSERRALVFLLCSRAASIRWWACSGWSTSTADRQLTPEDELVLVGHYGTDHTVSGHLTPDQRQE
jgi:hypothetical protein